MYAQLYVMANLKYHNITWSYQTNALVLLNIFRWETMIPVLNHIRKQGLYSIIHEII